MLSTCTSRAAWEWKERRRRGYHWSVTSFGDLVSHLATRPSQECNPMIVLGVDAGVTTGLAIVSGDDQRVLHHSTCNVESLQFQLTLLERTVDETVVERSLPYKRSKLARELHLVHTLIERSCPEAHWIDASEWKNTEVKMSPVPRGISEHEKDAIRMARWYLLRFDSVPVPT